MGIRNKVETFPYSLKSIAVADLTAISGANNQIGLEIINPTNFYACTHLFMRFRFLHDGTAAGRNVTSIKVQSDETTSPTSVKGLTTNLAPTTLTLDLSMDITGLRNETGRNVVMIGFDGAVSGTIKIFKLDMLYQVQGIR